MANYNAVARTNYFQVKDLAAFRQALAPFALEIVAKGHEGEPQAGELVAVLSNDEGGWPSSYYDEEMDDYLDVDLPIVIAEHLADGEVAIGVEVGFEKLRYLVGFAWAINSKGETRQVDLNDAIVEQAKQLGENVTMASY